MTRLVIDIHEDGDLMATKEAVAMLLEPLGRVRVVQVIIDGKAEIRFIRGRLKFGGCRNNAPFPSMVVIFRRETNER